MTMTTFINQNTDGTLREIGEDSLDRERETFRAYMNARQDIYDNPPQDLPPFNEYGLSFDAVEADDQDDWPLVGEIKYYRYQLSWGGPSDEIRFHADGNIEYVYMDWFCGVGFQVTNEDWAQWLAEYFTELDMLNFDN